MKTFSYPVGFIAVLFLFSVTAVSLADPIAFPEAEGSGRFATGGRGGTVYEVTNLNNSGPGSIVDAVSAGNRTIVFRVSGTIPLGDVILMPKSNTTIAGQTAPGDGICLKGRIQIGDADPGIYADNLIIRYLRVRVDAGGANASGDAVDIARGNNIIIDHVSGSYSRDEGISCRNYCNNVTVQWCIMSEALNFEGHSYGSLIRGEYGQEKTYHHNLYAHNRGRNPRPGNYTAIGSDPEGLHFDFRNNVVYNWESSTAGYNDDSGCVSRYNFIGNAYIRGLDSTGNYAFRDKSVVSYGYFASNSLGGDVPSDQWSLVNLTNMTTAQITAYKARSYLVPMESVTTTSAAQAKTDVLADAGASFPTRDAVDARMVTDVLDGTGRIILNTDGTPPAGGFWPTLNSLPAPTDSDHDGMPNAWETSHGLNPNDAADRNGYNLDANYTNLEVYLNGIMNSDTTPPAAPTGLTATAGYGIVGLDWNNNSEGDVNGYNVYRSTTSGSDYVKLNDSNLVIDSNYTDNIETHDTTYYYVVRAVDTSSNESIDSNEVFSGLYGDFTGNGIVEMDDLPDFLDFWLADDCNETYWLDLDDDCVVNFYEFSVLAQNWLKN